MIAPSPKVGDASLARGDTNANPPGLGLLALIAEDFATHERDLASAGFWALAVHRFGNWRMGLRSKALRAPMTLLYRSAFHGVVTLWGIDLPYNVKVGRRMRLGHHGCMILGAREFGDDVVIQHSVTIGLRQRNATAFPRIGSRVEIGAGACIAGDVSVGDDSYIGPNTVIMRNVRPGSALLGIPPMPLDLKKLDAP
jgi:serine O-acetyltransferase